MIKRIIPFVFIAAVLSSCGNSGSKEADLGTYSSGNSLKVEFASLIENPDNYMDKNIIVEGKVVHVCTMSGKKLFIVGDNPDVRLFIAAGEDMPKFPMELLGSEVVVEGKITRVAGAAMSEGEGIMMEGEGMHAMGVGSNTMMSDTCETETALASQLALADVVMEYKSHTVK
jgi:RecJ-like exonuclease